MRAETILLTIGLVGFAAVIITPFARIIMDGFRCGHAGHERRLHDFMMDCARAGIGHRDAMDQLFLREVFARMRRTASARVMRDPRNWLRHIDNAKEEAIDEVKRNGFGLVQHFVTMYADLPHNHILYPDACRAVERMSLEPVDLGRACPHMLSDRHAALTSVKPS